MAHEWMYQDRDRGELLGGCLFPHPKNKIWVAGAFLTPFHPLVVHLCLMTQRSSASVLGCLLDATGFRGAGR